MIWLVMIISGILTFAARFLMLSPLSPRQVPPPVVRVLRFVPVAVLSAIIFPAVFLAQDGGAVALTDPKLFAAMVAVIAAYISRSVMVTLIFGLAALWAFSYGASFFA